MFKHLSECFDSCKNHFYTGLVLFAGVVFGSLLVYGDVPFDTQGPVVGLLVYLLVGPFICNFYKVWNEK